MLNGIKNFIGFVCLSMVVYMTGKLAWCGLFMLVDKIVDMLTKDVAQPDTAKKDEAKADTAKKDAKAEAKAEPTAEAKAEAKAEPVKAAA